VLIGFTALSWIQAGLLLDTLKKNKFKWVLKSLCRSLLSIGEATFVVLCPVPGFPAQERCEHTGESTTEYTSYEE